MDDIKITVKDLKTWMTPDSYTMCKEIGVTIGDKSSYVQGSKHINPAVYYSAIRLQELNNMLATSTALNEEFARRLKKFNAGFERINDAEYLSFLNNNEMVGEFENLIKLCQELLK